jgi:hypothetical protein
MNAKQMVTVTKIIQSAIFGFKGENGKVQPNAQLIAQPDKVFFRDAPDNLAG